MDCRFAYFVLRGRIPAVTSSATICFWITSRTVVHRGIGSLDRP